MAVLNLSMEYRGKEHGFFPGYLKKRLDSYLLGIWRSSEITTTQLFKERKEREKGEDRSRESYRILKSDLEYSGGSLDEEITVDEGKGEVRRADLLPDESWSEDSLINGLTLEELIDSLSDPLDREIFDRYYSKDESQAEIGQNMGITQQAVAKRLKKIEGHLQEGFKRGK